MTARDKNGRFAPGNGGGPGRPKRKREEQYLARMSKVVTLKDWEKITLTAVARAKAGEQAARKWLSDYLLGPPPQRLEHSGPDGGPIETSDVELSDDERAARVLAILDAARARGDRPSSGGDDCSSVDAATRPAD